MASPSRFGSVARMTSVTSPDASRWTSSRDPQVVRADALDRADRAAEHVVATAELAGLLDRDDVLRLLDDAEHRAVATRVAADPAQLVSRDVAADVAEAHLLRDLGERGHQPADVRRVGLRAGGRRSAGHSSDRPRAAARARRSGPGRRLRTPLSLRDRTGHGPDPAVDGAWPPRRLTIPPLDEVEDAPAADGLGDPSCRRHRLVHHPTGSGVRTRRLRRRRSRHRAAARPPSPTGRSPGR